MSRNLLSFATQRVGTVQRLETRLHNLFSLIFQNENATSSEADSRTTSTQVPSRDEAPDRTS